MVGAWGAANASPFYEQVFAFSVLVEGLALTPQVAPPPIGYHHPSHGASNRVFRDGRLDSVRVFPVEGGLFFGLSLR
jgi:hypothetical protein